MNDLKEHKKKFKMVYLLKGTKNKPAHKYKLVSQLQDKVPNPKFFNYGVITGKINDIIVVDIDSYKEDFKTKSDFYETFKDYDKHFFNTYAIETAKGGHHFYFKYDNEIKQTTSPYYIDIRSDGGYACGENSRTEDGKYKCVNDGDILEIPKDLKEWLLNNLYKKKKKKKEKKKEEGKEEEGEEDEGEEDEEEEKKEIEYIKNLDEDQIKKIKMEIKNKLKIIIKSNEKNFFKSYNEFLHFTTAMKYLNMKNEWDEFNKTQKGYDKDNNNNIWNGVYKKDFTLWLKKKLNFDLIYLYKPILKNKIKPDIIINREKLGEIIEDLEDIINNSDISQDKKNKMKDKIKNKLIIIKSDTGTGKTTTIKKYLKKYNYKFISIVSRKSLAYEQYKVFNYFSLNCFLYDLIDNNEINDKNNYIFQLDSIIRLLKINDYDDYIIYLDEFSSLLLYLLDSNTLINKRVLIFNTLIKIINGAKKIICTDADISDISISFFKMLDIKYLFIENEYKHNRNIIASEINDYNEFIAIIRGYKKYIICTDSKTHAEIIYKLLDDIEIKLITSETDDTELNLDEYDKIIYSPKIIYGLDSTIKRPVFCYYTQQTISPPAFLQQINRCRNIKTLYFYFANKKYKPNYETFEEVREKIINNNDISLKVFQLITCEYIYDIYLKLYIKYEYNYKSYNTNKYAHFIELLKNRGFNVFLDEVKNEENKKLLAKTVKQIKEEKKENFNIDDKIYKDINNILKIPLEEIENYKEFFLNKNKLFNIFNVSKLFYKDYIKIRNELQEKEEFNIKKIKSLDNKIKFLLLLKKYTNNEDLLKIDSKNIYFKNIKLLNEEYKTIFNKKTDINFKNIHECNKIQARLYNELFKIEKEDEYLIKSEKIQINKKRFNKYTINEDFFNKYFDVLKFSQETELEKMIRLKQRIIKPNKT